MQLLVSNNNKKYGINHYNVYLTVLLHVSVAYIILSNNLYPNTWLQNKLKKNKNFLARKV
jgi:hypothetical protein